MNNDQVADVFIKNYGKTAYGTELSQADNNRFRRALVAEGSLVQLEKLIFNWGGGGADVRIQKEKHLAHF